MASLKKDEPTSDDIRERLTARIDSLMSSAEEAFSVADDASQVREIRERMAAKGHRQKALAHELGRSLVPSHRQGTDLPPPDWADGVDAAAGVLRAEIGKSNPRPLADIVKTLEGLAEHYPGRRTKSSLYSTLREALAELEMARTRLEGESSENIIAERAHDDVDCAIHILKSLLP